MTVGSHGSGQLPLRMLLRGVVDAAEPPSRARLAVATGLSPATVSVAVDQLIEAGLVTELAPVLTRRAGRPAVPLAPAAGTVVGVGLQVDGAHIGIRVVDLAGSVVAEAVDYAD
ncbi:MAG: MarR family transcriptional regulator, partial [Micrococcales bacterium]|nr:MarR family transcriptional regulator [Micrococcales bacterium]